MEDLPLPLPLPRKLNNNITNPMIWCKVEEPAFLASGWTRVPLTTVTYTSDLQDAIKIKFSPKLDAFSSTDLIVQAKSLDKTHLEKVRLVDTDTIVEVFRRFEDGLQEIVENNEVITEEELKDCRKHFGNKIILYVQASAIDVATIIMEETVDDYLESWITRLLNIVPIPPFPELHREDMLNAAGRFSKTGSQLVYSNQDFVDMRLDINESTEMGKKIHILSNSDSTCYTLFAPSGAGKTRSIFDVAMHHGRFVIYVECNVGTEYCRASTAGLEPTGDRNFIDLYKEISFLAEVEGGVTTINAKKTKHLIYKDFAARILFLVLLQRKYSNVTPRQFLVSQLNNGQACISSIKDNIAQVDISHLSMMIRSALEKLKATLLNGNSLIFAIDEASRASKMFFPAFRNQNGKPRGLLTPILEVLNGCRISLVIAGTVFTLKNSQEVGSDLGKGIIPEYLHDFKPLEINEVEGYIKRFLDISGCSLAEIENWNLLAGRPRFTARFIQCVINAENKHVDGESKQDVLQNAFKNVLDILEEQLTTNFQRLADRAFSSNDFESQRLRQILEPVFIHCRFFQGIIHKAELDDDTAELVNIGIASVVSIKNSKFIKISEPLCVRVASNVLSTKYIKPDEALIMHLTKKLVDAVSPYDSFDTSKGFVWQYLALAGLLNQRGKTVAEFFEQFYKKEMICHANNKRQRLKKITLPSWTEDAIIDVEFYGNRENISLNYEKKFEDDVDVINYQLKCHGLQQSMSILVPEAIMRPDGISIGHFKNKPFNNYWTLLTSAKLYKGLFSGSNPIEDDKRSTDWQHTYLPKDPNLESKAPKLRNKLEIVKKMGQHLGSLRIHFILPGLARSQGGKHRERCRIEGNDLILYIDKNNLKCFFSEDVVKFIEEVLLINGIS